MEKCLNNLELLIGRRIPNDKKVTLYIHISCLVERLIRQVPIENYNNLDQLMQCQENMINNIKRAFSGIEETYNVKINVEEIGYVYDIITAPTEDLEVF
ncbi:MAG: PRD domain-containing protein [Peptostreptococcaceae bacterium]|nr:PRD domain-containing protein [Peptostreptococcaceae bacterium]